MKQLTEPENRKPQARENSFIDRQSEEPKTVLIRQQHQLQQQFNCTKLFQENDAVALQSLLRFKSNLAKKIIKKLKHQ